MRYLLIFLVVLLIAWRWRTSRSDTARQTQRKQADAPTALDMVRCAQCGVHVPAPDALPGRKGAYCSADHLRQSER
jgi:uncharacterized protein